MLKHIVCPEIGKKLLSHKLIACRPCGSDARFGEHLLAALHRQTPFLGRVHVGFGLCSSNEHGGLRRSQRECRSKYGCRQSILERPIFGALWARMNRRIRSAQVRARARVGLQVLDRTDQVGSNQVDRSRAGRVGRGMSGAVVRQPDDRNRPRVRFARVNDRLHGRLTAWPARCEGTASSA